MLYIRELGDGLKKLKTRGKYTDFTICVGDREFRCHRVILAAVSEYFETMFDIGGMVSNQFWTKPHMWCNG